MKPINSKEIYNRNYNHGYANEHILCVADWRLGREVNQVIIFKEGHACMKWNYDHGYEPENGKNW